MQYIYALTTESFKSSEDYYDRSPTTEYFYVGRTKNIEKRRSGHASNARTGSTYPYHEKIRQLGENWDVKELASVPDDEIKDHEEYFILKMTIEGHSLLNIKRGDIIRSELKGALDVLERKGIKSSKDYAKAKLSSRTAKISQRERRQIEKALVNLGLDKTGEKRRWRLGDEVFLCDRYVSKKEIAELRAPSTWTQLDELISKIERSLAN